MTRRTVTLEIVKTDLKSEESLVNAICDLATKSNHNWRCLGVENGNGYGFWVAGDGEMDFDFKKSYGIYDINSVCFESEEEMVWDNYEDDIKEVAKKYPQFEFYYHIVSEGVGYLDEVIYVHCSTYSRRENNELSPKQLWETVLRRETQTALESKQNDYALVIDLIKQELQYNTVYTLSFTQPVFVSREDDNRSTGLAEFMLVFKAVHVYFGIENITLDEIEYGMSLNRER